MTTPNWNAVYERLKNRIESSGVRIHSRKLGPQTTGVFDGSSITTNSDCDLETQCHNLGHAFGHIAQWSLDGPRCERLYDALHSAKERRRSEPQALEEALQRFREYEEEASGHAAWLLNETGNAAALASFTPFARADIEAIVSYHRDGVAPIWHEFFAAWQARAAHGEIEVRDFVPVPIPPFTPAPIAPQEVVRGVRDEMDKASVGAGQKSGGGI
jgi:hypothetical protein